MSLNYNDIPKPYILEGKNVFFSRVYKIKFEDTDLYLIGKYELAKDMVNMLNGAYLSGYSNGYLNSERDNLKELKGKIKDKGK